MARGILVAIIFFDVFNFSTNTPLDFQGGTCISQIWNVQTLIVQESSLRALLEWSIAQTKFLVIFNFVLHDSHNGILNQCHHRISDHGQNILTSLNSEEQVLACE